MGMICCPRPTPLPRPRHPRRWSPRLALLTPCPTPRLGPTLVLGLVPGIPQRQCQLLRKTSGRFRNARFPAPPFVVALTTPLSLLHAIVRHREAVPRSATPVERFGGEFVGLGQAFSAAISGELSGILDAQAP